MKRATKVWGISSLLLAILFSSLTARGQATLTSINISPSNASVPVNTSQQFIATGIYSDGSAQDLTTSVTWSSSIGKIAKISNKPGSQGLAAALSTGTTLISATYGGIVSTTNLTVTNATLTSFIIQPVNPSTAVGYDVQFMATGTFSDGSTNDAISLVTWASSNTSVATIGNNGSKTGLATAVAAGNAMITASYPGISSASTQLTVTSGTLVSIAVAPPNPSVPLGSTQQFVATGKFSDGTTSDISVSATWSSSAPGVASVDKYGLATSKGTGTSQIVATFNKISGSATLTVTPALSSIVVTPATASIPLGRSRQYVATGNYTDGTTKDLTTTCTWGSSDSTVAAISNTSPNQGLAATTAQGTTNITASYAGLTSPPVPLTVTPPVLDSIAVTPANPSASIGSTQQFTATGTYSDASTQDLTSTVTWSSSATSVATISSTGLASGLAAGSTTITAASGTINGSTTLTVIPPATLAITPATTTIARGAGVSLTATATFSDGSTQDVTTNATWSSSAPLVARVSSQGVVTGVSGGSAIITATASTSSGNISTTASITVVVPRPRYVYATGGNPSRFVGLSIDGSTGALAAISGSPFALPSGANTQPPQAVAVNPSGTLVYVADYNGNIAAYSIDALSGTLTPVQGSPFATGSNSYPWSVAVDPNGKFLYVSNNSGIGVYRIDGSTGALAAVTGSPFGGVCGPRGLAVSGSFLHVASACGNDSVYGFTVNATTGGLTPLAGSPFTQASGGTLLSVAVDPSGRFLYATNPNNSTVEAYSIESGTGALTAVTGSPFAAGGSNPNSVTVDPSGTFVYVANYYSNSISAFILDSSTGALTAVPGSPFPVGGADTQSVAVDPSGQFVYATNYYGAVAFSLNTTTGGLTAVPGSPFNAGSGLYFGSLAVAGTTASSGATLTSLQVTPMNPTILSSVLGQTQQFVAVGTYSDGSQQFLTSSVSWSSSDTSIATISAGGLATTTGFGTATIMATLGSASASTTLTVTSATLSSITIFPMNYTISLGHAVQYSAVGYFEDGSNSNITNLVTWTSSDPNVATISATGLATSVGTGTTTIGATLNGVSNSTTLTIQ
jgi:6-phosphogluconolactonase (cycloisomerase 2 family)